MIISEFIQDFNKIISDPIPWNEPHFSSRSLKLHLDQTHDVNSRREIIIQKHVNWIHGFILKGSKSKILELACGPGLYLNKLAQLGHQCTGIDISPAVIDHAKSQRDQNSQYFCEDILKFSSNKKFDFIFLNFGWFHNFKKEDARQLLNTIQSHLSEEGLLLLELLHFQTIYDYAHDINQWHTTHSGIFSDNPYLYLQQNQWIEDENLAKLIYYIINNANEVKAFHQYYQAYDDGELENMLSDNNFLNYQYFSNICEDDDFDEDLYFLLCQK